MYACTSTAVHMDATAGDSKSEPADKSGGAAETKDDGTGGKQPDRQLALWPPSVYERLMPESVWVNHVTKRLVLQSLTGQPYFSTPTGPRVPRLPAAARSAVVSTVHNLLSEACGAANIGQHWPLPLTRIIVEYGALDGLEMAASFGSDLRTLSDRVRNAAGPESQMRASQYTARDWTWTWSGSGNGGRRRRPPPQKKMRELHASYVAKVQGVLSSLHADGFVRAQPVSLLPVAGARDAKEPRGKADQYDAETLVLPARLERSYPVRARTSTAFQTWSWTCPFCLSVKYRGSDGCPSRRYESDHSRVAHEVHRVTLDADARTPATAVATSAGRPASVSASVSASQSSSPPPSLPARVCPCPCRVEFLRVGKRVRATHNSNDGGPQRRENSLGETREHEHFPYWLFPNGITLVPVATC